MTERAMQSPFNLKGKKEEEEVAVSPSVPDGLGSAISGPLS
jgi:hypothetical protein